MRITIGGVTKVVANGSTVATCIATLMPDVKPLGAMLGGETLALNDVLDQDAQITPITFSHEEGRRIYERSLRLLLIAAASKMHPNSKVRISNSIGYGLFLKLLNNPLSRTQVSMLEMEMNAYVISGLEIEKQIWSLEKAIQYYYENGLESAAEAIRAKGHNEIPMYGLGGIWRHFYGVLLPDVSAVTAFALRPHYPGLVLQMPSPCEQNAPAPYVSRPKFLSVFSQSQSWSEILNATNASDINHMMGNSAIRAFIRINEALHDKSIAAIADQAVAKRARCILVSGPSSSGKTTFSNRLAIHLRVLGVKPMILSMDNFYFDKGSHPRDENGKIDYEHIERLDLAHLDSCLERLLALEEVEMPIYDFSVGKRLEKGTKVRLNENDPIIIEGIHALNPLVTRDMNADHIFKIFVSALGCMNQDDENRVRTTDLRLLRRIVRDKQFRNTPINETMSGWESVRKGEDTWIFPYQEQADVMFNTSLNYELSVLKNRVYDELEKIGKDNPNYLYAYRLKHILDSFNAIAPDILNEIPPLSIIREFIGGCTLYD